MSPTVYVSFSSLGASDLCGQVGGTIGITTLPFLVSELSTQYITKSGNDPLSALMKLGHFTQIDFEDFGSYVIPTSLSYVPTGFFADKGTTSQCICTPPNCEYDSFKSEWKTDICSPLLQIPTRLLTYDPAWATCEDNMFGIWDPPGALDLVRTELNPSDILLSYTDIINLPSRLMD